MILKKFRKGIMTHCLMLISTQLDQVFADLQQTFNEIQSNNTVYRWH